MDELELEKLKYPIGKFQWQEYDANQKLEFIETLKTFPETIKSLTMHLNEAELATPYRPDGWTVLQVVHHCADSHMNAFIRFKLALTENKPTVKAYEEQLWAKQADYKLPASVGLSLIEAVHTKWVALINSMTKEDFAAKYIHPQSGKELDLNFMLSLYHWHCHHHLAHIRQALV